MGARLVLVEYCQQATIITVLNSTNEQNLLQLLQEQLSSPATSSTEKKKYIYINPVFKTNQKSYLPF